MAKKIVLLLQGGGALGAFQCGVWGPLQRYIEDHDHELIAVAGASIGAVNAALIARHLHDPDGPDAALKKFWTQDIPTPPIPFLPLPGDYWRAWNGLLTGLLGGNPALFHPLYPHWTPLAEAHRFWMPLYDVASGMRTLRAAFGRYRGNAPLLMVETTDVKSGEAVLFDSVSGHVTANMVAASTAIPVLFSPVEIDGRHYWDGEMRSGTLLPHVLARLRATLPPVGEPDDLLVIVVDMFSASGPGLPSSSMASHYRLLNIVLGGKLSYDLPAVRARNAHLDTLSRLLQLARQADPASPLVRAVEDETRKLTQDVYGRVEVLHIGRDSLPHEHVSRDFDYSPSYLARLIRQGETCADAALQEYSAVERSATPVPSASAHAHVTDIRTRRP